MILNFLVASADHPVGGVLAIYEFANAMSRRGHEVHLLHVPWSVNRIRSLEQISWCDFDPAVRHHLVDDIEESVAAGDFVFCFDEHVPARLGLPLSFVGGHKILPREYEERLLRLPHPKVCISRWLVDIGRELGVPDEQLVHVPLGVRHDQFRVLVPIDERPARISMCYAPFITKGSGIAVRAVELVRRRFPDITVLAFGTTPSEKPLPSWVTHAIRPPTDSVVRDFYNASSIFVTASKLEGFGLPSLEAMACGCALVTSRNGGSDEFAFDGDTASVFEPREAPAMAERIEQLLADDAERIALANRGAAFARTMTWDSSAEKLERFLVEYGADPQAFQR
jgi:glycosyltransferase involved in cell wall biosynthesis